MSKLHFTSNAEPTLGIELELALVDGETMALSSSIREVLARLPAGLQGQVKPELMQCYLEINTAVCRTVDEAEADLRGKLLAVQEAVDALGLRLLWTATHPFSLWREQQVTPTERYQALLDLLQDTARQLITFGLHVHVGVDSGDKAVMICDRILRHLPLLLALSCNSPCWDDRVTGLRSNRSRVMEGLPTAGLPPVMRNWSEYTWLINHLIETGFINTIREIWWDVRPHNNFGTVEVRICDMPGDLDDALALAALTQCLVQSLSEEIDEGTYYPDCHPMLAKQNKWRAYRYGTQARLVDPETCRALTVPQMTEALVRRLWPTADVLRCQEHLHRVLGLAAGPSWAERQVALLHEVGAVETVRRLSTLARVDPDAST